MWAQTVQMHLARNRRGVFAFILMMITLALLTSYPQDFPQVFFGASIGIALMAALRFASTFWPGVGPEQGRRLGFQIFAVAFPVSALVFGSFTAMTLVVYGTSFMSFVMLLATGLAGLSGLVMHAASWRITGAYCLGLVLPSALIAPFILGDEGMVISLVAMACFFVLLVALRTLYLEYWSNLRSITLMESRANEMERARNTALAADQLKSDFLATVSHELRTPLHGLVGLTELIGQSDLPPEQRDAMETLQKCTQNLNAIVEDLLDLSRIEAGELKLDPTPTDLGELVHQCAAVAAPLAKNKGLHLEVRVEESSNGFFVVDGLRLGQVLSNLLSNAIKFTDQGEVGVALRLVEETPGASRVVFEVRDTGMGVAEKDREKIFERFVRGSAAQEQASDGSGLGLAICQNLVTQMGGTLDVHSEMGEGSVFSFALSLARSDESPKSPRRPQRMPRFTGLVLLAEDNPVNQMVARKYLETLGLKVRVVSTGTAALEVVAEGGVDLVLMDCRMPDLDGLEATRRLRAQSGPEGTLPVIGFTAHGDERTAQECRHAGMNDLLIKPARLEELAEKLAPYLTEMNTEPPTGS
jgi:signal transduction histidine kinase/ActR/RegA family two-component response regulator